MFRSRQSIRTHASPSYLSRLRRISRVYSLIALSLSLSLYRKIALVIILTRAGLDLDPTALKRLKVTVPKLGLIPWVVEATVVAALTKYLLDLPWVWGFLLGSIIAAVSPAVVVPCLFRLRAKGYGVAKVRPFCSAPLSECLNIFARSLGTATVKSLIRKYGDPLSQILSESDFSKLLITNQAAKI